jgi:hypothetical protein
MLALNLAYSQILIKELQKVTFPININKVFTINNFSSSYPASLILLVSAESMT